MITGNERDRGVKRILQAALIALLNPYNYPVQIVSPLIVNIPIHQATARRSLVAAFMAHMRYAATLM